MSDQLQAARDQIAEMCGWKYEGPETNCWVHAASGTETRWGHHPIPDSLDFVSRVWPQRFYWQRSPFSWSALEINRKTTIRASKTSDELADRMTLLLKVLVWLRDNDRPAFDAACEKIRKEIQG